MVGSFNLLKTPKIFFGEGKLTLLPELISQYGKEILIITGNSSFITSRQASLLFSQLDANRIVYHQERIAHEPSPADVNAIVAKYYKIPVNVVVSIGGGSVIDTGKAVSAMLLLNEPVKDYLESVGSKKHPGIKVPFIAVPTTAGTGSEATNNAVISETGPNGFKRSLRHENFIPDIALVDPELTKTCPPSQTALSGMDAFTQLLESYFSGKGNRYTAALALDGIKVVKKSLKIAIAEGDNIEARSGMCYAAFLSGITLANAGLGLVHGFASSIGGLKAVPHGLVCGTLMGVINRFTVEKLLKSDNQNLSLKKFTRLGKILSEEEGRSDEDYAFYVANYIESLTRDLKIPTFAKYNFSEEEISKIIETTEHKNHPVVFTKEELREILITRIK
jgi:alcohol dehydrogenase class IV